MADDAQTTDGDQTTDQQDQSSQDQAAPTAAATKAKSYSKAEVDAMVNKAKASTRRDFADYLDLKAKAEELDTLKANSQTEEQKLRERADRMTRERDSALTRARDTLVRSAIVSTAARLGCVDPEAVAALLPREEVLIEGDEVVGVEEAVKALLAKKPYLRAQGATRGGAEMTGGGQEPAIITRSQIRDWARKGGLTPERQKQINEAAKAGRIHADR